MNVILIGIRIMVVVKWILIQIVVHMELHAHQEGIVVMMVRGYAVELKPLILMIPTNPLRHVR